MNETPHPLTPNWKLDNRFLAAQACVYLTCLGKMRHVLHGRMKCDACGHEEHVSERIDAAIAFQRELEIYRMTQ